MSPFVNGIRLGLPIVLGYLPVGFAFGVLAVEAGMNPVAVGLMSYFVYAGSAQLIAADLLAAGASTASIVFTTFIVNLRHLLMSAALTPYLRKWSRPLQAWFCFEMTDETFAANQGRFATKGVDKAEALGLNAVSHAAWTTGGIGGALFNSLISDVKPFGLDFALPAMFIALLLPHFAVSRRVVAIASGASLSLLFALAGAGEYAVILATLCAATLATFWNGGHGGPAAAESRRFDGGRAGE